MKKIWGYFGGMEKLAVFLLAAVLLLSALAPVLAPYDPNATDISAKLEGFSREHLLGTDHLGRDMLSRLLYGGRASLLLAAAATSLSMVAGMLIGLLAGYVGGAVDSVIMIITSMFQGIPSTCFTIALIGTLGVGNRSLILALVVTSWAGFSRIVRGEVMQQKKRDYVLCAKNFGISDAAMILRHILPNMADDLIVLFSSRVAQTILSVAALSFLGLGVQPPTPDWGVMISDARAYFYRNIWLLLLPCGCIFLVSWSVSTIGDGFRNYIAGKRDVIREV